jgi:hypothetical protein
VCIAAYFGSVLRGFGNGSHGDTLIASGSHTQASGVQIKVPDVVFAIGADAAMQLPSIH